MNNKRFLLILLLSVLFIVLVPGFVSAGCCLMPFEGQGCKEAAIPSVDCAASTQEYRDEACELLAECKKGCCCGLSSGVGMRNISCFRPQIFIEDSSATIGNFCSCGGPTYTISGTVRDALGNPLSDAVVSSGGISYVSLSNGRYILNRVPSGTQIEVAARKDGCLSATTTIATLDSNRNNVNISLNCACAVGTCDVTATVHAFCVSTNNWRNYDPTLENTVWCNLCRNSDPINCQQTTVCNGGDGSCPLSCSNVPGTTDSSENPIYDADCECSPTISNGVCPARCDRTNDRDCIVLNPDCGNGFIEFPESCDPNARIEDGQLNLCSLDECSNCNCYGTSRCGNLILNPGETCEIGMMCANGSMCEDCKCGMSLCSASNLNPKLDVTYEYANQRMFVNWSVLNACRPSVGYYSLFRCEGCNAQSNLGDFSPLNLTILSTISNYSDRQIEARLTYCYYVRARYMDGRSDGVSAVVCETAGDAFCLNPHTREFCLDNDRYMCGSKNNLTLIKDCSPGYCMPPDYSEITTCVNQSVCDYCNGLYGMFANLPGLKVRINGTTSFTFNWCNSTNPAIPAVEGCYYDKTRTLFSAFKYCSNVSSCYNYKSKTACEDPDSCGGKTGPCVWNWTQRTKPELGGLCRPFDENDQQCELCDSKEFNWLSPSCTPEICKLFGNCYYIGIGKGSWHNYSCSSEKLLTCADYNDSNRCAGGQPVRVDVTYNNTNGNRISGTHQLTPSNDNLDLGKCYWHDYNNGYGLCIRDADGFPAASFAPGAPGWDCDSNDLMCSSDFDNPVTTILPRSGCNAGGMYGETVNINYVVSDDRYFSRYLKTYFCITPQRSAPCYPTHLGFNGTYTEIMTSSGFYDVYYYSQDPAKNLEVVNSITIEVDASIPTFNLNPINLQPGQTTLSIGGTVSPDALYICANNTQNKKEACQNNCAYNNTPGCITGSGQFSLNVPVAANSQLANIIVYAQDSACNYFENTVQAALSGRVFPKLRINISG